MALFQGFERGAIETSGATINYIAAGGRRACTPATWLPRNACLLASNRAGVGEALPRDMRRSPRVWRQLQARGSARPLELFQARHGPRHGRADANAWAPDLPSRGS